MFLDNKYRTYYFNIVTNAKLGNRKRSKGRYLELHHIVPRCMAPEISDLRKHKENGVLLTAKEHILAHRLLCKITEGTARTSCLRAYHSMCFQKNGGQNKRYPSAHQLGKAREAASMANKGRLRGIQGVPEWASSNFATIADFKRGLQEYVDTPLSDPAIGLLFSVTAATIHNWRNKLHICRRRGNLRSREYLWKEYVDLQRSAAEIANDLGCTGSAVQQALKSLNIPIRDAFQRQALAGSKRSIPKEGVRHQKFSSSSLSYTAAASSKSMPKWIILPWYLTQN